MKTKNNVQKTILTAIIILTGIAILNGNTSAQGFWGSLTNSNDNPLAMKTDLSSGSNSATSLSTTSFDYIKLSVIEEESPLEIEDWMTKEFYNENKKPENEVKNVPSVKKPEKKVFSTKTFIYTDLDDPELKFERWMFDPKHWKAK